jgi:hypothetical protein
MGGRRRRDGAEGDSNSRIKKGNSSLSSPLSRNTLSPFPLSSCSQAHRSSRQPSLQKLNYTISACEQSEWRSRNFVKCIVRHLVQLGPCREHFNPCLDPQHYPCTRSLTSQISDHLHNGAIVPSTFHSLAHFPWETKWRLMRQPLCVCVWISVCSFCLLMVYLTMVSVQTVLSRIVGLLVDSGAENMWKEQLWPHFSYYGSVFPQVLKKPIKIVKIANLWILIWTRDLKNVKHECYPLSLTTGARFIELYANIVAQFCNG